MLNKNSLEAVTTQELCLKSVECVQLLTLHHSDFPIDTNVVRVASNLEGVLLQPPP